MKRRNFSLSKLDSPENLCEWNVVQQSLHIRGVWAVKNFSSICHEFTSEEFFISGNIKYQLVLTCQAEINNMKLSIKFQGIKEPTNIFWKAYLLNKNLKKELFYIYHPNESMVEQQIRNLKYYQRVDGSIIVLYDVIINENIFDCIKMTDGGFNEDFEWDFCSTLPESYNSKSEWIIASPVNITAKWVIPNFSNENSVQEFSNFRIGNHNIKFFFDYNINKKMEFLFVTCYFDNRHEINSFFWQIYFLKKNKELELLSKHSTWSYDSIDCGKGSGSLFWENPNDYLHEDNSIILICHVVTCQKPGLVKPIPQVPWGTVAEPEEKKLKREFGNFRNILGSKDFSDINLIVSGSRYPAHKNILAARSPVFSEMLTHNQSLNELEISNLSIKAFTAMMEFIYTAELGDVDFPIRIELLVAAERYAISGLKKEMEKILANTVTPDNVATLLLAADSSNSGNLKEFVINFIVVNLQKISRKQYIKISQENFVEIFSRISNVQRFDEKF